MPHNRTNLKTPPRGLAVLAVVGPSFIWCAEYIGSGEVILATRTGAILGHSVIWAVWIMIGLYIVMPKMFNREAAAILRPHWIFALGLAIAFLVFGYFCVFQIRIFFDDMIGLINNLPVL